MKKCACCGHCSTGELYEPLSEYFIHMYEKYHVSHIFEFLNVKQYTCKYCKTSDRGRMICAFLKMSKLPSAKIGTRLLHIAPEKGVEGWIRQNCPNVLYESTDLFATNVTFQSDIQNMISIKDNTYDYFICSHVLEHVQDDQKAMKELFRILKPEGIGIILVPISIGLTEVDEEWGLSEAENWKRFAQYDHCRIYSRNGLIERLQKNGFYVNIIDKSVLGEDIFNENSFVETSTLYVVKK